ncbi:glycosyltransferase [Streptomyces fuscigenes]|uniref:glycosyltransferase n=1 Tax=Streptomyces fuscigenes TaxID=1528880 RepID=UPI001F15D983|nr:glycosyltransferase [Streptomyces fuscigenes]MCF3961797.1 glycosyltransferase [Streptomyces fuscigenes]
MSATTAFVPAAAGGYAPDTPPEYPRHVVTAVLVSHDGARWLPDALAGLVGQERPVQNVVAADTGSADASAQLLSEALGDERVLHLARRSGFGTAVEEAVRVAPVLTPDDLPYLRRPSSWDPVTRTWRDEAYEMPELPHGEPVQWLWLLHDDCAPAPDALAELLRVADSDPDAAVVGPKLRGWYDRRQLLEVGVSIANSGRRWTGLDRREQDQGQHDQVRSVLSVSSAGMLVRRDVWEQLGGFDRSLPLMRDDVDLCWRAHAAGHSVLVAPEAVLRHAEAASRERRTVDCVGRSATNPHRVDKAGAVFAMLANTRGGALPWVALRLVVGTLLRTLGYLLAKAPGQAVDEVMGLSATLLRPGRILAGRRARAGAVTEFSELRPLFPPPGATIRATVEQAAASLGAGGASDSESGGSRHGVVESGPGGEDADYMEIEQFARLKKLARRPGPVLFAVLLVFSLVACRALLAGGSLAGGALLPAPDHISALWDRYADTWHAVGTGGTQTAPPYLAVLASLSVLFLGSTGLALTVLLVCSVPLAGVSAYFASRSLVPSRLLRAWAAVVYAFLPAATGALATGRLGTAVLVILLPVAARAAVSAYGLRGTGRGTWRATWAYTFLLTVTTAFTPVVWPLSAVLALAVLVLRRREIGAYGPRVLTVLVTPMILLAPWSLTLLTSPRDFLREAGLDFSTGPASALDLLGMDPGGPKAVGGVLMIGVVLAALAALLRSERGFAVRTAWVAALVALVFAVASNRSGWAGPATLVYAVALLAAGLVGADGARLRVAEMSFGWRQPAAALIAVLAGIAPLVAAFSWMVTGAAGPLERTDATQVPAFVAEESTTSDQPRTLVLSGTSPGSVSYSLVRGEGAELGDAELTRAAGGDTKLDKVVANLVAGSGADQTTQLRGFAIRYVLLRDGAPHEMSRVLDATPGLSRLSQLDGSELWRIDQQVSRIMIVPPAAAGAAGTGDAAAPVSVASSTVDAHTKIPSGPSGRVLRIADRAADGWQATLDGQPLPRTTVDGWAQGFQLPTSGGRLDLTYDEPITHTAWVWLQGLLGLVLLVLALPGGRPDVDDDLPDEALAAVPPEAMEGEGRRARRLRAAAEAEAAAEAAEAASARGSGGTDVYEAGDPYETPGTREPYGTGAYAAGDTGEQPAVPDGPDAGYSGDSGYPGDEAFPGDERLPGDEEDEADVFTPHRPAGAPVQEHGMPDQDGGHAGQEHDYAAQAQDYAGQGPDATAGDDAAAQDPQGGAAQGPYAPIPHQQPYGEWDTSGGDAYGGYPAQPGYPQQGDYAQQAAYQQQYGEAQGAGYQQQFGDAQQFGDPQQQYGDDRQYGDAAYADPRHDPQQYAQQQWGYDAYQQGGGQAGEQTGYDPAQYDPYGYGAQQSQRGQDPNHPYPEDQGQDQGAGRRPQNPDGSSNQ